MSAFYYDEQPAPRQSKLPFFSLAARVATLATLVVSVAILKTNSVTLDGGFVLTYSNWFVSYNYMFWISVIGVVYSFLQIPFAVIYLRTKKRLIDSYIFVQIDFYGDKVMAFVLATAVGAAFGATRDLIKSSSDDKIHDFLNMGYIAAAFMLLGSFSSVISSILSSFTLVKSE